MTADEDRARLFVALPLPRSTQRSLTKLQPEPAPGVRPVAPSDMHITLHFLGSAAVKPVAAALAQVHAEAFALTLTRPGHFKLKGRRSVLWFGIAPEPRLAELHARIERALEAIGLELEQRRYLPHVTLARMNAQAPKTAITAFEAQAVADLPPIQCDRFALYSSDTAATGARYRVLETWPLALRR